MDRRKVLKEKRQQSWKILNKEQKRQKKKTEDNTKMTTKLEYSTKMTTKLRSEQDRQIKQQYAWGVKKKKKISKRLKAQTNNERRS